MSAPVSHLTKLPVEILEQIFLCLPGQDVIKVEVVSRHFRDILRDSPILQYRRKLFAAGLVDNPSVSCDLAQRQKACEEYVHKWSNAGSVVKSVHELPPELFPQLGFIRPLGRNFLISWKPDGLAIIRVPSTASRKPIEGWSIPPSPFAIHGVAAHLPDIVLAVAGQRERRVEIHLLNILNGTPYYAPPSNIIGWSLPPGVDRIAIRNLAITGSRLMLYISLPMTIPPSAGGSEWWICVWDWKTGNLVLDFSSKDERRLFERVARVTFLDEFWMMVFPHGPATNFPGFTLIDTLVSQVHLKNFRLFSTPTRYHNWAASASLDCGMSFGTLDQDGPLIVDPTQAFIVLQFVGGEEPTRVCIVLRTQALIKHACSMGTETCIPWEEWGRNAIVMEMQALNQATYVQGVHVIEVEVRKLPDGNFDTNHLYLRAFDFSKWGSGALCDEGGETVQTARYKDGREFSLERSGNLGRLGFGLLGDGIFYSLNRIVSPATLNIWELV